MDARCPFETTAKRINPTPNSTAAKPSNATQIGIEVGKRQTRPFRLDKSCVLSHNYKKLQSVATKVHNKFKNIDQMIIPVTNHWIKASLGNRQFSFLCAKLGFCQTERWFTRSSLFNVALIASISCAPGLHWAHAFVEKWSYCADVGSNNFGGRRVAG